MEPSCQTHPARCIEGTDCAPAARERAPLVALDGSEPRAELCRAALAGQACGNQFVAHAADAQEIDLRLRDRARERAEFSVHGRALAFLTRGLDPLRRMDHPIKCGHDLARERLDRGGGCGIGEDRDAEAMAQRIAGARRLAGGGARTAPLPGFVGGALLSLWQNLRSNDR